MAARFVEYFALETIPPEMLSDCPWRDNFMDRLQNLVKKYGTIWSEIVNAIDRDEAITKKHQEIVYEAIESTLHGLIINATTLYEKHLEKVTTYAEKVNTLEMILEAGSLDEEHEERDMSLVEEANMHRSKIVKLEKEIANKEQELKRQDQSREKHQDGRDLREIIESYKKELEEMWDKCHCDGQIRSEFQYMYTTTYNYETMRIFEKEIRTWKKYFADYREILDTVKTYQKILKEIEELELNTKVEEIYKNRNCQLLKEVQKRNRMRCRLISMEEKLKKQSEYYVRKHHQPFRSFGSSIESLILRGAEKKEYISSSLHLKPLQKTPKIKTPKTERLTPIGSSKKVTKPHSDQMRKKTPQKTPVLPKFRLNENNKNSPKNKLEWKPSRLSLKLTSLDSDEESWTTEYCEFEKDVVEQDIPRSSDVHKEKNGNV